jgi:hypothetical protein
MRKVIAIACSMVLLVTIGFSQKEKDTEPKIEGSGHVVTKDIAIQPFDQLEASGVFNVVLTQGNKESLKIEAEDNLQPLFEIKNEGPKLVVEMKKDPHFNSHKKMTIYITFKNLKSMDLKMVGNVSSDGNLNFRDLALANKSVGNLRLSGKAENATIRSNSVGSIKASDLLVQTMDIDNDGVGSAEVNAVKELKVKDSFLGKVRNAGSATAKRINTVVI